MATLTDIALAHADMGFYIIPLYGKRTLTKWGEEHRDYSTRAAQIINWYSTIFQFRDRITGKLQCSAANGIGCAMTPSDLVVLDLDGPEAMDWARKRWSELKTPYYVKSPREDGGIHLWYRQDPNGPRVKQGHGLIAPHVDVKAHGSMVVLPGSLHKTGNRYRWGDKMPRTGTSALPLAPKLVQEWQLARDNAKPEYVPPPPGEQGNYAGFQGTIFYHHVKVFSGDEKKLHIECPNANNHGGKDRSGTVLYPANKLGGLGKIHCEHASCTFLGSKDYKHMIGIEACNQTEKDIKNGR